MSVRIVVVGSSNTDLVLGCPILPRPGETILGGEFSQFAGGKGANQAVAAARAGAKVAFVGGRGDDHFGRAAHATLRREGVNVRHFRLKLNAPSGVALILVGGKTRENLIGVARSANDLLTAEDVRSAAAVIQRSDAVICQLETPLEAVQAVAEVASESGVPLILNPAPARRLRGELLRAVSVLTPNEHEARLLAGVEDLSLAAAKLRKRGCGAVVITLGAKGALVSDDAGTRLVKAPSVRPVDTVGAGDCFTAWLAHGVASGRGLTESTERAVRAAAIAVTRAGAQAGMPFAHEVA